MADENAKIDDNNQRTLLGVDSSTGELRRIQTDPSGRVKATATISTTLLDLTDTPSTYSGQANKVLSVNSGETAVEFTTNGAGDLLASNNLSDVDTAATALSNIGGIGAATTDTLTNKTYDAGAAGNSLSLTTDSVDALTEIAAALKSGADATLVTGTAGTDQNLMEWDANGDAIDSGLATADVVTGASTDTFTNKTFDANGAGNSLSNVDVADLANGTDGELITWDAAGAPATVAAGTSGHVLTSNGAGAAPTFQAAAGGGTARRNMNIQLSTDNAEYTGSQVATADNQANGVSCAVTADGGSSNVRIASRTVATWDFYDKDPEINININYIAGSATGNGAIFAGDTGGGASPTVSQTTKSMFILCDTASGTPTWSLVNANGTTNTNTTLVGITSAQENVFRVIKDSTTNIKCYTNYTLKATSTTNLPSGDLADLDWLIMGAYNDGGDTTSREGVFGYVDVLINSPTG